MDVINFFASTTYQETFVSHASLKKTYWIMYSNKTLKKAPNQIKYFIFSQMSEFNLFVERYKQLLDEYNIIIKTTSGCGERGQGYIDEHYDALLEYFNVHKEILLKNNCQPPRKFKCGDDGYNGALGGIQTLFVGRQKEELPPDCLIQ